LLFQIAKRYRCVCAADSVAAAQRTAPEHDLYPIAMKAASNFVDCAYSLAEIDPRKGLILATVSRLLHFRRRVNRILAGRSVNQLVLRYFSLPVGFGEALAAATFDVIKIAALLSFIKIN
jgi:hypothetical protein